MWIAIIIVALLVLAAIAYLASLKGDFQVKRNREIAAPPAQVFAAIVDFKSWPQWSPWLIHEPGAEINYSDKFQQEGGYFSWDGERVGAGKLSHLDINPNHSIRQEIEFTRPFKSINQVHWSFEEKQDSTIVSWEMIGKMPFFLRFMVKQMEPMIGRDYELGLALLNGYVNAEAAHPQISFIEREELADFFYWAIPLQGNLRQLETARKGDIATLEAAAEGQAGLPLCLYHHFDPGQLKYDAEIAIPVAENAPASNYTRRQFHGGLYFKMHLRGAHEFLPLGWYALISHCRMHKIRLDFERPSLEIYNNDPSSCENSNQVLSTLYIAIRK